MPVFRHSDTEREGAAGKPRAEESWRSCGCVIRVAQNGEEEVGVGVGVGVLE